MRARRNLARKLMRALFQATLLASVRSKRRMWAIVFCPFKIHFAMISIRITARWPFMHFQRSIFVLYLVNLVQMLKSIGESLCETDRVRRLFAGMTSYANSSGWRIDYSKVREYLLKGWRD